MLVFRFQSSFCPALAEYVASYRNLVDPPASAVAAARRGARVVLAQLADGCLAFDAHPVERAKRPGEEGVGRVEQPLVHVVALDEGVAGAPFVREQSTVDEEVVGPVAAQPGGDLLEPEDHAIFEGEGTRRRIDILYDVRVGHLEQIVRAPLQRPQRGQAHQAEGAQAREMCRVSGHGSVLRTRRSGGRSSTWAVAASGSC